MTAILQRNLPFDPFAPRALPGVQPLQMADWLIRDEAFAAQMALRDDLIAARRAEVVAQMPQAAAGATELLDLVLAAAYPDAGAAAVRPDGVRVPIDRGDPMGTLGRLVQEDLCLMQRQGDEHVLTAAALCFPASWRLSEKIGRPMIGIHRPVAAYDAGIAKRVQRLLDGVREGRPLWRFNAHWNADPALFQPRSEADPRPQPPEAEARFMRCERQCLVRLPQSGAVAFSIHTYVVARQDLIAAPHP